MFINKEEIRRLFMETESAKFWLSVLNELKSRGVEDVLIFSIDGWNCNHFLDIKLSYIFI